MPNDAPNAELGDGSAITHATPGPHPAAIRFGTRHLLLLTAAVAGLSAVMAGSGVAWQLVIGALLAIVAAHVFGTHLGTRLRDTSAEVQRWRVALPGAEHDEPAMSPEAPRPAAAVASSLADHGAATHRHGWAAASGAVVGIGAGVVGLRWGLGNEATWPGVMLGAVSSGVIGAWAALLGANFWFISRRAWREADRERP